MNDHKIKGDTRGQEIKDVIRGQKIYGRRFLPTATTRWFLHFIKANSTLWFCFHFLWLTTVVCIGHYLLTKLPVSCQCLSYSYIAPFCSWTCIRAYYTDVVIVWR